MPHDHRPDHDRPDQDRPDQDRLDHDHGGQSRSHHGHHHPQIKEGDRRMQAAVAVNLLLTAVQIIAGVISGSLALVADAIHNLSDALSLIIAFFARKIGRRPADAKMTFGYGRAEVVAALINYTTLIIVALYLAAQGVERLFNPAQVEGWIVVVVAGVALIIDTITALLVMRMARDSVNIRAAFLHNVADALGSVAVIIGGTLILLYDWRLVDPLITLLIAGYILWHAGREVGPVVRILMLGAPEDTALDEVITALRATDGIADLHHLHLWRMQEHETALEAHVVITEGTDPQEIKDRIKAQLFERFSIRHSTLEVERDGEGCKEAPLIGH